MSVTNQSTGIAVHFDEPASTQPPLEQHFWEDLASQIIMGYPMIIITIFGVSGNVLAFIVFSRKSMRKSVTSLYFRVISVTKSVVLLSGALFFFVNGLFKYNWRAQSMVSCKITAALTQCSCYSSCWVLVVMSIDRFIGIYFPHKYKLVCSKSRAKIVIFGTILTICVTVGAFFCIVLENNQERTRCGIAKRYKWLFMNVYQYVDLLLLNLIPTIVLFTLNIAIIIKLYLVALDRQSKTGGVAKKDTKGRSATFILLSASFIYFLCTGPYSTRFLVKKEFLKNGSRRATAQYHLYIMVCRFLYNFSHAVMFCLYCIHGSAFRRELKVMFSKEKPSILSHSSTSCTDVSVSMVQRERHK